MLTQATRARPTCDCHRCPLHALALEAVDQHIGVIQLVDLQQIEAVAEEQDH